MNNNILNKILIEWNDSDNLDKGLLKTNHIKRKMNYDYLNYFSFEHSILPFIVKDPKSFKVHWDFSDIEARKNLYINYNIDSAVPINIHKQWLPWNDEKIPSQDFYKFLDSIYTADNSLKKEDPELELNWLVTLIDLYYSNYRFNLKLWESNKINKNEQQVIFNQLDDMGEDFIQRIFKKVINKGYYRPSLVDLEDPLSELFEIYNYYFIFVEGITHTNEYTWILISVPIVYEENDILDPSPNQATQDWIARYKVSSFFFYTIINIDLKNNEFSEFIKE